ncbi:MAG: IspD/TarI family cytidylyltransferase [Atopobiaceae bacterium]|jgi:2-C-methyl-D-erythritol 4-phosphate cytidylyltransferase
MASSAVEALVFAGGSGSRMGSTDKPKQFLEVGGHPIISYTLERFAMHPQVSGITVSCIAGWIGYLQGLVDKEPWGGKVSIVPGGSTGQESIFCALKAIHDAHPDDEDAIVLVHDGVRPLIDERTISACIESVRTRGATATTARCVETVIIEGQDGRVERIADRSKCRLARAPQAFRTNELYRAHLQSQEEGRNNFIDSISLMSHYGHEIFTVDGPIENIKVTTPGDYFLVKSFMDMEDFGQLWRGGDK